MARLAERAPIRQVELAEPVLGDAPNVSRLVDALVARGYVDRSPDPADRRSRLLSLTSEGAALAARAHERVVAERERVFAGFTSSELDRLAALLDRLDDNVRSLLAAGELASAAARPGAP